MLQDIIHTNENSGNEVSKIKLEFNHKFRINFYKFISTLKSMAKHKRNYCVFKILPQKTYSPYQEPAHHFQVLPSNFPSPEILNSLRSKLIEHHHNNKITSQMYKGR